MQRFNLRSRSASLNGAQENGAPLGKGAAEAKAKPVTRAALGALNKNTAAARQPLKAGLKAADVKKAPSRLSRPPIRKSEAPEAKAAPAASDDVHMPSPAKGSPAKAPSPKPCSVVDEAEITEDRGREEAESYSAMMIPDIDEGDEDDAQNAARFAADVFVYLRHQERRFAPRPDFLAGKTVTARNRAILVDWLHQVHNRFALLPETMYLTVNVVDRYTAAVTVPKDQIQLVGVTGMLIAAKYEEIYAPTIDDFVYITDDTYSRKQIIACEIRMLSALGCQLGQPLPIHFLRRCSKAAGADGTVHSMGKYLCELATCDYALAAVLPSHVAAAALLLASRLLAPAAHQAPGLGDLWTPTLVHYSALRLPELEPVVRQLAGLLLKVHGGKSKLRAVRAKFSAPKFGGVAKSAAIDMDLIAQMAQ